MSKIGRMPIQLNNVTIDVKGKEVHYKGKQNSGVYKLPENIQVELTDDKLWLKPTATDNQRKNRDFNRIWGMHRALLSNAIVGSGDGFTKEVIIKGLGYKATLSGNKITFTLGYSHKIDFELPKEVTLSIDKTGQKLTFSSFDKQKLGQVCSLVKALKKTEPYKQTGIRLSTDRVIQKAGKTKA